MFIFFFFKATKLCSGSFSNLIPFFLVKMDRVKIISVRMKGKKK